MKIIPLTMLLTLTLATSACTQKTAAYDRTKINPQADDATAKKPVMVYKSFDAKGTLYVPPPPDECAMVDCGEADNPSWWEEFATACESEGYTVISTYCCNPDACTGLPSRPDGSEGPP